MTPEERWEAMTHEERWTKIQVQASEWLREQRELRKAREMEPPPVDQRELYKFIKMQEQTKKSQPLLSNYERALVKVDEKKKRKKSRAASCTAK